MIEVRICDICCREITDEGGYEIVDGKRIDNCGECMDMIKKKYKSCKNEKDEKEVIKEYIKFMESRSDNCNNTIKKLHERFMSYTSYR